MASHKELIAISMVSFCFTLSLAFPGFNPFWGGFPVGEVPQWSLYPEYYQFSCPQVDEIVMSVLDREIAKEPRMAASLLRLHFHDCFVQGCDASLLLDDSEKIVSEKGAVPNKNSLRGFEVIDEIKAKLEEECPGTVSCADIVALAARGSHTIGMARCVSFKQRLYNQNGNNEVDATLEKSFYYTLRTVCPRSGGDNNITPLDFTSPTKFDNYYFNSIMQGKGLLNSDEVLLSGNDGKTMDLVKSYAEDEQLFFEHYAKSIVKMGNISPLTGFNGEVRKNCRRINEDI